MPKLAGVALNIVETEEVLTHAEATSVLQGVARAARSGYGIARALADIARSIRLCPWIEGELRMEIVGENDEATLHIYSEQGAVRERVLAPVTFVVPLEEIEAAVQATLLGFAPFHVVRHKGKVVFSSSNAATLPPPQVEVAPESLDVNVNVNMNPHEKPTIRRPMFVMPAEASRSGTHLRQDPRREED
jgi:hypothetical protein